MLSDAVTTLLLDFARELAQAKDAETFFSTVPALLRRLIPAEQVFWTRTDFTRGLVDIRGDEHTPSHLQGVLGELGPTHPAIQTYVANPADLSPRRVSDVVDQTTWHRSPIYSEGFAEFGAAHQLSLVTSVLPPGVGTGWTLTRSGSDFTIQELSLAHGVLPVLVAVADMLPTEAVLTAPDHGLSQRDLIVLSLLADGLTAASIGRRCGITERTVRKHLTVIYEKLGCHDRLMAVSRASSLGLVEVRGDARYPEPARATQGLRWS